MPKGLTKEEQVSIAQKMEHPDSEYWEELPTDLQEALEFEINDDSMVGDFREEMWWQVILPGSVKDPAKYSPTRFSKKFVFPSSDCSSMKGPLSDLSCVYDRLSCQYQYIWSHFFSDWYIHEKCEWFTYLLILILL